MMQRKKDFMKGNEVVRNKIKERIEMLGKIKIEEIKYKEKIIMVNLEEVDGGEIDIIEEIK